jgi:hypothetical protein
MITLSNQYTLSFSVAGKDDFLTEADLQGLKVVEEAGNILPTFEITFTLEDSSIIRYLNEGNPFKISFGEDKSNLITSTFRIMGRKISKMGQGKYLIRVLGVYDALTYYTDCKITTTDKMSGAAAILEIASQYFSSVDSNIRDSGDVQYWVQHNTPNRVFVNEIWMHCFLPNSFPAIGISSQGSFILRDVRKLSMTKEFAWKFVSIPSGTGDPKEIVIDPISGVESVTGLVNAWVGYGREKNLWDVDNSIASVNKPTLTPMLADSFVLDRMANPGNRAAEFSLINENVDPHYWSAYQNNLAYLSVFGCTGLLISFTKIFANVKVLDLVSFRDLGIDLSQTEGNYSGSYLVSKVARIIENKVPITMVQLNRESLGELQGDLL